jgi:predicted RNase H-like HicB family nuclease
MYRATVIYHYEPDGWWAESPNFPGFTAVGESFNEVRQLVREGIVEFSDDELILEEAVPPLKSADPLTGNFGLRSEPTVWRRQYSEQPSEPGAGEDPSHTTASDERSEKDEGRRNLLFQS